jgi:putative transposase
MVEEGHLSLSIVQQCRLLGISHSGYYYVPATESARNLQIMQAIDKIHLDYPFYGFRRIQVALRKYGFEVGKKLIIRLMKLMAIDTIYPKPKTTIQSPTNTVYPYLLRGLEINRCNQVWEMDITYIVSVRKPLFFHFGWCRQKKLQTFSPTFCFFLTEILSKDEKIT